MNPSQCVLKNAKCVAFPIENFHAVINEEDIEMNIATVGDHQWDAFIGKWSVDGVEYLSIEAAPVVPNRFYVWPKAFSIEMAICVKNQRPERWERRQGRFEVKQREWIGWMKFMRMDTVLDPDSGFLTDDGSLIIQFEIRVDFFTNRSDGRKILNFFDPFEGSVQLKYYSVNLHASKHMLMLNSPMLIGQDVIPEYLFTAVHLLLQLIHGVKIRVHSDSILNVLYFAHKFQVLTVLCHLEVQIKGYSDEDIHEIFVPHTFGWIKTLLGKKYHKDFLRMIPARKEQFSEKFKKLNIRKRKMLLAITRAPFTSELDSYSLCDYSDTGTHRSSSFFISRFFSKTVKRITGR